MFSFAELFARVGCPVAWRGGARSAHGLSPLALGEVCSGHGEVLGVCWIALLLADAARSPQKGCLAVTA